MPPQKRPAAAVDDGSAPTKKKASSKATPLQPITMAVFCLATFVEQLLKSLGVVRNTAAGPLTMATACSGSGAPSLVLGSILGESGLKEVFACDSDVAAAHVLLQNCRVEHVYADAKDSARPGSLTAFCVKHCRGCKVPQVPLKLFVAGFSCQANSVQNPSRFQTDPTTANHWKTFLDVVAHIRWHRPENFVLENVVGCLKAKTGGIGSDKAPLIKDIMSELTALPDYNVTWIQITAHPLPTARPRLYFLGSRKVSVVRLKTEVLVLAKHVQAMAMHHLSAFVDADSNRESTLMWAALQKQRLWEAVRESAQDDMLDKEAAYAAAMSKARAKAGKRLPASTQWPVPQKRESQFHNSGGPWLRGQIDIYEAILRDIPRSGPEHYCVADVSQSANRGCYKTNGAAPTLTTSTQLWDYEKHKFLDPSVLMSIHGFPGYDFTGCTEKEAARIVGNSMAASSLVIVFLPLLKALGYLSPESLS